MKTLIGTFCALTLCLSASSAFAGGSRPPGDQSRDCGFVCDSIPPDAEVLYHVGDATPNETLDPTRMKFLVWNIYKQRKNSFVSDFKYLATGTDVVMLQEVALDPDMANLLEGFAGTGWEMAASFLMNHDVATGVANGSVVEASSIDFRRSRDLEPFSNSPKATIAVTYPIEGQSETLLTLNIHGVNFRGTEGLENQIADLEPLLAAHKGPILFAGDFNTKNPERVSSLSKILAKYGLSSVTWENPESGKQLDQAYARGLVQRKAKLEHVDGSDHPAMVLEFALAPSQGTPSGSTLRSPASQH